MGEHTKGYVNLAYVTNSVLVDLNDFTTHQKKKVLQYAITGYTELNMKAVNNVRVAYLNLSAINTVNLPDDFIDHLAIGVEIGGRVITLTERDDMVLPRETDDCGNPLGVPASTDITNPNNNQGPLYGYNGYYFAAHYRNGQYVGELYGDVGGQNFGYYRIDRERRQIVFNAEFTDECGPVILEYMSSGVETLEDTVIPRQALEALRCWIHWNLVRFDKRVPANYRAEKKGEFAAALDDLTWFENSFTKDEYLDHARRNAKNVPRR